MTHAFSRDSKPGKMLSNNENPVHRLPMSSRLPKSSERDHHRSQADVPHGPPPYVVSHKLNGYLKDCSSRMAQRDNRALVGTPRDHVAPAGTWHDRRSPAGMPRDNHAPAGMTRDHRAPAGMLRDRVAPADMPRNHCAPAGSPRGQCVATGAQRKHHAPASTHSDHRALADTPRNNNHRCLQVLRARMSTPAVASEASAKTYPSVANTRLSAGIMYSLLRE